MTKPINTEGKTVLLFSGGLDSLICYYYLRDSMHINADLVYVDLGHRYNLDEIESVKKLVEIKAIPEVKFVDYVKLGDFEKEDADIPARNLYLMMVGANLGYDNIVLVVQQGERKIPDRSATFFRKAESLLSFTYGREIQLLTPFFYMDKTDMVEWYKSKKLPQEFLEISTSCYTGKGTQCGNCPACYRKAVALVINDLPIDFMADNPITNNVGKHYLKYAHKYDRKREGRIKLAYKLMDDTITPRRAKRKK